jgi:hypothetical protein
MNIKKEFKKVKSQVEDIKDCLRMVDRALSDIGEELKDEVEFVVGGEYSDGVRLRYLIENTASPNLYGLLDLGDGFAIVCGERDWMRNYIQDLKYTGRKLKDLITE